MSKWEGDDILLNSLESQVVLWSFLFSLFFSKPIFWAKVEYDPGDIYDYIIEF